jgi:hypothetical protein
VRQGVEPRIQERITGKPSQHGPVEDGDARLAAVGPHHELVPPAGLVQDQHLGHLAAAPGRGRDRDRRCGRRRDLVNALVRVDAALVGQPDRCGLSHGHGAAAANGQYQIALGSTGRGGRVLSRRYIRIRVDQQRDSDRVGVYALQHLGQQASVGYAPVCDDGEPPRAGLPQFAGEPGEAAQAADHLRAD